MISPLLFSSKLPLASDWLPPVSAVNSAGFAPEFSTWFDPAKYPESDSFNPLSMSFEFLCKTRTVKTTILKKINVNFLYLLKNFLNFERLKRNLNFYRKQTPHKLASLSFRIKDCVFSYKKHLDVFFKHIKKT